MFSEVVSVVSLVVSGVSATYAVLVSHQVSQREVTTAIIAEYYSSMRALTEVQLREWRLAHLFEVAENYAVVVESLKEAAPASEDSAERIALRLNERAVALAIFGVYEHVVYQLEQAERAKNKALTKFLSDAQSYFTVRLLRNARLQYLWSSSGGNLECEFEAPVREHHQMFVAASPATWDAMGPYG